MTQSAFLLLKEFVGSYSGQGVNHEQQLFRAHFQLLPEIPSRGFALKYQATGLNGEGFHTEHSLIGIAPDQSLALWIMSSNHPFIVLHVLQKVENHPDKKSLYFSCGDFANKNEFREIVQMDLWKSGELSYTYHWGMPGMDCEPRSAVRMRKDSLTPRADLNFN